MTALDLQALQDQACELVKSHPDFKGMDYFVCPDGVEVCHEEYGFSWMDHDELLELIAKYK